MKKNYIFLWAITISFIHVLFLWNWWRHGIQAIGINLTVFWLCVLGFYIYAEKEKLNKKSAFWIVPIVLIAVSFSFYATEFSSGISLLILPWIFFLFTTHQSHANLRKGLWSRYLSITYIFAIGHYIASIFFSIPKTAIFCKEVYPKKDSNKKHIVTQIITGVSLLFILAGIIIIPLLSSADAEFAKFFKDFLKMISDFFEHINFVFLWKIFIAILLTPAIVALNYYWKKKIPSIAITNKTHKKTDHSIAIGIILGGVLAIYLLFIVIQIKILFIGSLPIKFADTETVVKSGFWQLIILTLLNIIFYAGIYNKSTKTVQKILSAFTMASLLLVVSAGQRVYLYVYNYGLSFEKFYALYTVMFCTIVFIWFISLLLRNNKKANIVKTLLFITLWMYSITTIIPLERIIFNTNLALTQREDSRVNINELTMLGFDALKSVEKNKEILLREAVKDAKLSFKNLKIIEKENIDIEESKKEYAKNNWNAWLDRIVLNKDLYNYYTHEHASLVEEKRMWYEKTFGEIFYKPQHKVPKKIRHTYDFNLKFHTTFKCSNQGFEFDNLKNFKLNIDDFYSLDELERHDLTINIYDTNKSDEEKLKIKFYNKNDKTPSKNHRKIIKFLKKAKKGKYPKFYFKNFPNKPVYMWIREDKEKYKYYNLLIEFPKGWMSIESNNKISANTEIKNNISKDEYINLITTNNDFKDIIESIRPITANL